MAAEQRIGRVNSGDVSIFYRAFGVPGRTPILCMHGSNYFDSYDWIGVCSSLASDREVAVFDRRGYGESGWSPGKDYSLDAMLGDMHAVIGAMRWTKPIVLGHSGSGRVAIAFAAHFPDHLSKLIVVDSAMGREENSSVQAGIRNELTYPTIEA